ncbi:MAG: acetyl-CoA carboxylase biotin carboxyl carrier protein subunit [Spirochaetes bacterium]|nr:MAG: acetyl-CoA carboxylase biotin carboxyl carrier protein subunit [Spirochaetota bacterium]RKX97314.1 MAG: acetyl-CoA carboxylase biotin carboxyl carrier protein subunit [Spirochaetota bacterium]
MKNYKFSVGGEEFTARIVEYTEDKVVVDLNGSTYDVVLIPEESAVPAAVSALPKAVSPAAAPAQAPRIPTASTPAAPAGLSAGDVTAPIPGVVKQISVAVGDKVTEGSVVAVLEAMKMENQIPATSNGTVSKIAVALGDSVLDGQLLIQIEAS